MSYLDQRAREAGELAPGEHDREAAPPVEDLLGLLLALPDPPAGEVLLHDGAGGYRVHETGRRVTASVVRHLVLTGDLAAGTLEPGWPPPHVADVDGEWVEVGYELRLTDAGARTAAAERRALRARRRR